MLAKLPAKLLEGVKAKAVFASTVLKKVRPSSVMNVPLLLGHTSERGDSPPGTQETHLTSSPDGS
jgi:hypothetical protein